MFDPAAGDHADPETASKAVWFDAFVTNIDRTARNANLLWWHKQMYFIDHGASLFFHHNWRLVHEMAIKPFYAIKDHILLPWASQIREVDRELRSRLTGQSIAKIVEAVPPAWLPVEGDPNLEGYLAYFRERLLNSRFVEEAIDAHSQLI